MVTFQRPPGRNPIITAADSGRASAFKVYNPGVIRHGNLFHAFYRLMIEQGSGWHSVIYRATSSDGLTWSDHQLVFAPHPENPRHARGFEDPRLVKIGNRFYLTFAAFDGVVPRLHLATSADLQSWTTPAWALPGFRYLESGGMYVEWTPVGPRLHWDHNPRHSATIAIPDEYSKSGALFPERIDGRYWMIFGEHACWLASSQDAVHWQVGPRPFLTARHGTDFFDNTFVEAGPPPLRTDFGWLVLYHGINDQLQYRLGFLILDLADPRHVIYRSQEPIFEPTEPYELGPDLPIDAAPGVLDLMTDGSSPQAVAAHLRQLSTSTHLRPQVAFVTSAVIAGSRLHLFYGAGDLYICTASAPLAEVLSHIESCLSSQKSV